MFQNATHTWGTSVWKDTYVGKSQVFGTERWASGVERYYIDVAPTLAEVYEKFGEAAGDQWAYCINYYYDTRSDDTFYLVQDILSGGRAITVEDEEGSSGVRTIDKYPFLNGYAVGDADRDFAAAKQQTKTKAQSILARGTPFPDVPTDVWYAEAVAAMKDSGIIMGCDDGLFHPEKLVTQGEFYAMLLRAGTPKGSNISGGWKVGDHWAGGLLYVSSMNRFSINGMKFDTREGDDGHLVYDNTGKLVVDIVKGNPENPVSRTEAVTQIVELWWQNSDEIEGSKTSPKTYKKYMPGEPTSPSDIPDIIDIEAHLASPAWDMTYAWNSEQGAPKTIAFAYNKGICKGVDEAGTFDPDGLLTRAEVVQLLYNAGFTSRQQILYTSSSGMAAYEYSFKSEENIVR